MLHFTQLNGGYLALDAEECRAYGRSLAETYQHASPFPHIVIDEFLEPEVLKSVLAEFPASENKSYFDREQERFKFQYQPHESPAGLTRNLFAELNSQAFLGFLEELTG